jgi:membrane associated rhomboid family serine protease
MRQGKDGRVADDDAEGLVELRRCRNGAEARSLALVLVAVGIDCRLIPGYRSVGLHVAAADAARAAEQLALYEQENPPRRAPPPLRRALHGADAALAYGVALAFLFGAARRHAFGIDWLAAGAAEAGPIRAGEWWRAVTALGLHADFTHLAGNLGFGALFGVLLAQLVGSGLAWLAILLAGTLGNLAVALVQGPGHASIGASTGIFGALGALSGYTLKLRAAPRAGFLRRWTPVAAGIMLLAFLGFAGERTDVTAHVAGFAAGAGLGFALAHAPHFPQRRGVQPAGAALAAGLFALGWGAALGM